MAKSKFQEAGKFVIPEKMRKRIPRVGDDAYLLKVEEIVSGSGEEKLINEAEDTSFATISTIVVESTSIVDSKTLRVNGMDISLDEEDEGNIFDTIYNDKDEAISEWKKYMDERLKASIEKRDQWNKVVDFLQNQLEQENY